jgi:hypothetical protein
MTVLPDAGSVVAKTGAPSVAPARSERLFSAFETWPPGLFYLPVVLHWFLLSFRHHSLTLPSLANPCMEAGGLCGESKAAVLSLLGPEGRRWLAPFTCIITDRKNSPSVDLNHALQAIAEAGLSFPVVAKPNIGCQGSGVRRVDTPEQLKLYLEQFPRGEGVILQRFIPHGSEAGVFYVRPPGSEHGRIFSITLKYFPRVVGDGVSTLEQLIRADPRASRIAPTYVKRHTRQADRVLARGEEFPLVFVGNHCKGAIFRNGAQLLTPAMQQRFDCIAREIPDFHFGRFDVRFRSIEGLQRGDDFSIIEFNGAGSEATHIWDRDTTLWEAYRVLREQLRLLFEIGRINRTRGLKPIPPLALIGLYLKERRLMRCYPVGE